MKEVFEQYGQVLVATTVGIALLVLVHFFLPLLGDQLPGRKVTKEAMATDKLTTVLAENAMSAEYHASVSQFVDTDINSQITLWDANGKICTVSGLPRDVTNYDRPGIYEVYFSYEKANGRRDYGCVRIPVQPQEMEAS